MAANDFSRALARVLVYEGGKVDDPQDPGGRTNQGVTQRTYNAWRRSQSLPSRDVYLMEPAERDAIYRRNYWDVVGGDKLPLGLDLVVFDAAVNSGTGQAVKWLQAALGDSYDGQHDGVLGDKTMQAVLAYDDADELVQEVCSHRLATLQRLRTYKRFGKGWSARIANVQKLALAWIDNAPHPEAVQLMDLGGHQKAVVAGNLKDPPVSQMAAHIGTAASSVGAVASTTAQQITALQDYFSWAKWVFGGLMVTAVILGLIAKLSADAKDAADKGVAKANVDMEADASLPTAQEPEVAEAATAAPAAGG